MTVNLAEGRMRRRAMKTATVTLALGILLLAGCTPTTPTTSDRSDDDSSGGETMPPCLVGTWDLDVERYQDDTDFYITESGLPIANLDLSGTQVLSFGADGQVTLGTNLTADTTLEVPGASRPMSTTTTNLGDGGWTLNDDGTVTIDNFSFSETTVSLSDPGAPEFAGCDFTTVPTVDTQCEGDTLFLIGPDAPYGTYWTRR